MYKAWFCYPAWVNNSNGTTFMMKQFADEGMTVEEARAFALGGCLERLQGVGNS